MFGVPILVLFMVIELPGYKTREEIYRSGRSVVYRAERESDGLPVIIKLHSSAEPEKRDLRVFRREFEIYRILDFPGVIKAHALEPFDGRLALVTEDFGAVSLSQFRKSFRWDRKTFLKIAAALAETLGQVHHRHYIHKDIKPDNILIHPQTHDVKLIDFDIASPLLRESWEARDNRGTEGTPQYMSPEQWGGSLDYRTDFYSLGITLYELATGRLPFQFEDKSRYNHAHLALEPASPLDFNPGLGRDIAAVLLKLMNKNPADRYQSGFGLAADFNACLENVDRLGRLRDFSPGAHDFSEVFHIPDKLYGREEELRTLHQSFAKTGRDRTDLVIVKGGSGIGKSALVEHLKNSVLRQGGAFITGKFDQYRRNIPYSSLLQAFREMITGILSENEEDLLRWRERIQTALAPNGKVIVDVLPDLAYIIGEQPPVPDLGPEEADNRFNLTFNQFVGSLSASGRPLVLFMDDLQWTDDSSLKLLRSILANPENRGLIIGSYRDREVDERHIVSDFLRAVESDGSTPRVIHLQPLDEEQVNQLVSETLREDRAQTAKLAAFVRAKTNGTPFFVAEFMKALHALELIAFDPAAKAWRWDLNRIEQENMSENVVELMSWNIGKLAPGAREIVTLASCIGNQFDLRTLAIVSEESPAEVASHLNKAMQAGLILPLNESYRYAQNSGEDREDAGLNASYRFLHDRVQQAAHSMLGDAERQQTHLRIGRLFLERLTSAELEEEIFAVAGHWNGGLSLLGDDRERWTAIELNQRAGRKARMATAYDGAANYLRTANELLPAQAWRTNYDETLSLVTDFADAEAMNSRYDSAEELIERVLNEARQPLDRVAAFEIRIRNFNARNLLKDSLAGARNILKQLKIKLPERPSFRTVGAALIRARWAITRKGGPESILSAPAMTDSRIRAVLRILARVVSTAYQTNFNLYGLMIMIMTRLTYQYGFTNNTPYIVATFGMTRSGVFNDYESASRYGKIALALLERPESREVKCRTMMIFYSFVHHWRAPYGECQTGNLEAARVGFETGDAEYAGYNLMFKGVNSLYCRGRLPELAAYFAEIREQMNAFHEEQPTIIINIWGQIVQNLREPGRDPLTLTGDFLDEAATLHTLREINYETGLCMIYQGRGLIAYLLNDLERCLANTEQARKIEHAINGMCNLPHLIFIDALVRLRLYDPNSAMQRGYLAQVNEHLKRFKNWTTHAPFNQEHRCLLIEAELERVQGRTERAANLFQQATAALKRNDFLLDSILINERAMEFFKSQGDLRSAVGFQSAAITAGESFGCEAIVARLCANIDG